MVWVTWVVSDLAEDAICHFGNAGPHEVVEVE